MRPVLCALSAALLLATPAHAASVRFSVEARGYGSHDQTTNVGTVRLVDQDAADDAVAVDVGATDVTVSDPAGLSAAAGCVVVAATQVRCPITGLLDGGVELDLELGGGNDSFMPTGAISSVTARGGPGDDRLEGSVGATQTSVFYEGGPGADLLTAGNAITAILEGGAGADRMVTRADERSTDITYLSSRSGISLDLRTGRGSRGDAAGDQIVGDVSTLDATSHDDRIHASDGGDLIYGHGGDDILTGGRGEDSLDAGTGDNVVRGGAGADLLSAAAGSFGRPSNLFDGGPGADSVHASRGTDRISGGPGRDRVSDVGPRDRISLSGGDDDRIICQAPRHGVPAPAVIRVDRRDHVGASCPRASIVVR